MGHIETLTFLKNAGADFRALDIYMVGQLLMLQSKGGTLNYWVTFLAQES